ncbi:hypothetical protein P2H44_23475 [Albimonas sp. CAU 1670]|uniref:hypothetical protein n=1 Tax=Albimonas sp. CAU 1670 TaxID=3032599 RepID=UPI0023DB5396|nr:hypothetical protein [Albimonas sp. CAU 1670]MDF2235527.1 hypothetical protein [Albimonas sp. CAU 1670]
MKIAKTAMTTLAAAALATTFGLAPAFADQSGAAAPAAPAVKTGGTTAEVGQAPVLGLPPVVVGVAVVASAFGLAVAASNSGGDNTPSTPSTR